MVRKGRGDGGDVVLVLPGREGGRYMCSWFLVLREDSEKGRGKTVEWKGKRRGESLWCGSCSSDEKGKGKIHVFLC